MDIFSSTLLESALQRYIIGLTLYNTMTISPILPDDKIYLTQNEYYT